MSDELNELRSEMARLQARIDAYESAESEAPVGRRNMLRALGAASAGAAVGGLALARPASAADPNDVVKSVSNNVTAPTRLDATGAYSIAGGRGGILTVTNDPARTLSILEGSLGNSCITALADETKNGSINTAIAAQASSNGAKLDAPVPLKLVDTSNSGPPTAAEGFVGQFKVDDGNLWYCVAPQPNAVWRLLASPDAAATPKTFTSITPYRAYDSRRGGNTPLTALGSRVVSVKDAIDPTTGAVVTPDAIPNTATAISGNLTAAGTTAAGFLAITPGDAASSTTSTVNYGGPTPAIANAFITGLSGDREVKVFIGGTPDHTSNFIIDVNGYWS